MSQVTAYHYAVMTKAQADEHAAQTLYGIRVSSDDSTVIAKLPTTVSIDGVTTMALPALFEYIDDNPALWADPSI
ncbi:MAG: hypothetical protein Unbinned3992contig1000_49 [Prokaryotic dsDNA virus sp.]|nr:MAG: hypothetical protein Unbinned3992contig1000_49 [Prokaryotic dsDNA virus sp.]|tara:strand:- start:10045 stop:10269 length:225 start_codon:yes stop_codon:yes gene_type:complete